MIEAIVLLVVAVVGVVMVAAVVVRDGVAHTEMQRRLQVQQRVGSAFRDLGRAMAGVGAAASVATRHMVDFAFMHFADPLNTTWESVGHPEATQPPMNPGDIWYADDGTFRLNTDGQLERVSL